ncbi:hypothetical protein DRP77_01650 [Candidatus Poribacteria bacterium]|nr:MAG: hypothetical protein DRP77_01650 [Candidatus Poribacteria bacterium]
MRSFPKGKGEERFRVSWRSILLGALLIPVNVYWVTVVEVKYYSLDGSCLPLFIEPVFILFLITCFNFLLKRFAPRSAFNQAELLVIYIMLVVSMTFAGHDTFQNLFGQIAHPFWFATPENEWEQLFFRYIPSWLTVKDKSVLEGYYLGESSIYDPKNFYPWIKPLSLWALFFLTLVFMMLCLNTMVRKRWTEQEKLAYPIIQLPLGMTKEGGSALFKNRVMWMGFAVAATITLINGLNYIYPAVPRIKYIKLTNVGHVFTDRPWDALRGMRISMYPFAIGLAFFLPLDLSFSCWFFFVFRMGEQVFGRALGLRGFPYFSEQASGAWFALAFMAIWATRRQLGDVIRKAVGLGPEVDDSTEPMPYRAAFFGFLLSAGFFVAFCYMAGVQVWVTLVFLLIYFLIAIAITRVRAELGTPHEISAYDRFANPLYIMSYTIGTKNMSPSSLTVISMWHWFNRGFRNHPMPNQLEAFKMAEEARIGNKGVLTALGVASVVSLLAVYWANLDVTYREGAVAKAIGFKDWVGWEAFNRLQRWLQFPSEPDRNAITYMVGAMAFTFVLAVMRMRFVWWPFHPAGYALAISYAMDYFWFAFFVSWLIKWILLRQGGLKTHRKAAPFFLGLILGDYVMGSIWAILGPAFGFRNYKIFI